MNNLLIYGYAQRRGKWAPSPLGAVTLKGRFGPPLLDQSQSFCFKFERRDTGYHFRGKDRKNFGESFPSFPQNFYLFRSFKSDHNAETFCHNSAKTASGKGSPFISITLFIERKYSTAGTVCSRKFFNLF